MISYRFKIFRCSKKKNESNLSQQYSDLMKGVQKIQNDCERKMMSTLKILHSGFISPLLY